MSAWFVFYSWFFFSQLDHRLCPKSNPEGSKYWKPKDIHGDVEFWQEVLSVLPKGHCNTELTTYLSVISAVTEIDSLGSSSPSLDQHWPMPWMPRLVSSYNRPTSACFLLQNKLSCITWMRQYWLKKKKVYFALGSRSWIDNCDRQARTAVIIV